jgi:hypothetical protein
MAYQLNVGDIVVDQISGEAGLLVERFLLTNGGPQDPLALWAWNVYWIGKSIPKYERLVTWTEYGLTNIIRTGTFKHFKDI